MSSHIAYRGANCESEGHDRTELGLPGVQQALLQRLLAVNARVVLVLTNGGPVATTWASANIPAMVDAWYSGVAGGAALANILFGVDGKAPAGKLPFMVARRSFHMADPHRLGLLTNVSVAAHQPFP